MIRKFWRVWLKYTSALYNFVKEISSHTKRQRAKQKKETDKLTNKAISPCLQYPEDDRRRRRKCPSVFQHQILPSDDNLCPSSKI